MKWKNTTLILLAVVLVAIISSPVYAHGDESFSEAEKIIAAKIPCDQLTEKQLEILGDYYMEQMHPGDMHVMMDQMMGGEGSETLRRAHINMAKSFYCGEHESVSGGMMDFMMVRQYLGGVNMMGFGTGYGMMGAGGWLGMGLFGLVYLAVAAFVFSVVFWMTYKWIVKNPENSDKKK